MTIKREELLTTITKIVAHPHTHITEHDRARSLAIFVVLQDYLDGQTDYHDDIGSFIHSSEETDFEGYVLKELNIPPNFHEVTIKDILK